MKVQLLPPMCGHSYSYPFRRFVISFFRRVVEYTTKRRAQTNCKIDIKWHHKFSKVRQTQPKFHRSSIKMWIWMVLGVVERQGRPGMVSAQNTRSSGSPFKWKCSLRVSISGPAEIRKGTKSPPLASTSALRAPKMLSKRASGKKRKICRKIITKWQDLRS